LSDPKLFRFSEIHFESFRNVRTLSFLLVFVLKCASAEDVGKFGQGMDLKKIGGKIVFFADGLIS